MKRIYQSVIEAHLRDYQQMIILVGPHAVGKTTLVKKIASHMKSVLYLNWNDSSHREIILAGPEKIYSIIESNKHGHDVPIIFLDNLNLYEGCKNLLKGYYDILSDQCKFIITVDEEISTYRTGQDSMMGRYFSYRIYPFTVAELCGRNDFSKDYTLPQKLPTDYWNRLLEFGGFPEPFQKATKSFHTRWSKNYREQLIKVNVRELAKVNDLHRIDLLAQILRRNVGLPVNYSKIAKDLQTTTPTIQHWHSVLTNLYYCFSLSPWTTNIKRSLLKAPKFYLYDWSQTADKRISIENLVASHLKKAVNFWSDVGLGTYELYYLRDKDKYEVDFLVVKNQKPWLMVAYASSNNKKFNRSLLRFHEQLNVPHVFQVVNEMEYVNKDCFSINKPVIVPLLTFLSQLI